jgi:hypothetical protein
MICLFQVLLINSETVHPSDNMWRISSLAGLLSFCSLLIHWYVICFPIAVETMKQTHLQE